MERAIKPVFLLADSQLLFWREGDRPFLARARELLAADGAGGALRAAYLGAANGDAPEFYDLFVAAMAEIGIADCRMIPTEAAAEDHAYLETADLILLAGGDIERGWQAFERAGLPPKLLARYYAGALMVGISAGAVQLGLKGWSEDGDRLFDTLRIVPFVVDAHDEPGWIRLHSIVPRAGEHVRGYGLPSGGGALYHPDYSVEPIRHGLVEISLSAEEGLRQSLLYPPEPGASPADGGGEEAAALDVN
jgi:peptidase E